jgi:hypothetical protein
MTWQEEITNGLMVAELRAADVLVVTRGPR